MQQEQSESCVSVANDYVRYGFRIITFQEKVHPETRTLFFIAIPLFPSIWLGVLIGEWLSSF